MADPLAQVERVQLLVEKGPQTAVAALFCVAFFALLYWHLRQSRTERLEHAKELAAAKDAHVAEVRQMLRERGEMAIREHDTLQNLLRLTDNVELLGERVNLLSAQLGTRRRRKEAPSDDEPRG